MEEQVVENAGVKTEMLREKMALAVDYYKCFPLFDGSVLVDQILKVCVDMDMAFVDKDAKLPNMKCLPLFVIRTKVITMRIPIWWDEVSMVNYLGRVNQESMVEGGWQKTDGIVT